MDSHLRKIDYFYFTIEDKPGMAYNILQSLADRGINMLAFSAIPFGPNRTQLTLFPDDSRNLIKEARDVKLELDGPHPAFLAQGDDNLGVLAGIHKRLSDALINVYASSGVTDGQGRYGYVFYVKPQEYEKASAVLRL